MAGLGGQAACWPHRRSRTAVRSCRRRSGSRPAGHRGAGPRCRLAVSRCRCCEAFVAEVPAAAAISPTVDSPSSWRTLTIFSRVGSPSNANRRATSSTNESGITAMPGHGVRPGTQAGRRRFEDAAARRDLALTRLNVTPQTSSSPSPQASYHTASAPPVPWPSSTRPSADGRHWRLPAHQRSLAIWRVCASLLQGLLPVATALGLAAIMTPWRRGIHRRCRRGYRVVHGPIRCRGLFGGRARAGAARRAGTRRGRLAAASHHSRRGGGRGAVCPVG